MGLSCRRFLIARDDTLGRLANTTFERMLRDPARPLAGLRGATSAHGRRDRTVELVAREPVRVVRRTFAILTFDDEGCIEAARFDRHQLALAESALDPVFAVPDRNDAVIDAAHRFIAQGASWVPSSRLARAIDDAALGRLQCRPLSGVPRKSRKAKES